MSRSAYVITVGELVEAMGDPDLRIIDCRFQLLDPAAGRRAYLESHVPGAVYADLDKDLAAPVGPGTGRHPLPDPGRLADRFRDLGIGATSRVIIYDDRDGAVAARAWWLLRWLGHDRAGVLDGGFAAWLRAGLATESGETQVSRGNFRASQRNHLVLETAEIVAAGADAAALRIVDVRAEARFAGMEEPIDPVAGHIPGTLNLPFSDNVDDQGRWKSAEELRSRLRKVLGGPGRQPWAVMCGSGVTACHLVIAGLIAGYSEPRVYVGSWSEWISDPSRPIAKGAG